MANPSDLANPKAARSSTMQRAINGVWLTGSLAVLGRASSFLSQLVAGWLLSPKDYGVVAMATGLAAISGTVRGSGITRFLVQRHDEYGRLARPSFQASLMCNAVSVLVFLVAGTAMTIQKRVDLLLPILGCMSLAIFFRTSVVIRKADLQARLEFKKLYQIDRVSLFLQHGLVIVFAVAQFGVFALVLPGVVAAAYEHFALVRCAGPLPPATHEKGILREIFRSLKWIMLGAVLLSVGMQGDYFVVGLGFPQELAGAYYFGFVAAASFSRVFTSGLGNVLMPLLARYQSDAKELRRVAMRAQEELGLLLSIVSLGLALATPAAFHLIWQGKYDEAILPAVAVLVALPIRSLGPVHESLMEATGRWRLRAGVFALDAVGTLASAAVGVATGTMVGLCTAVIVYRLCWGVFLLAHSGPMLGARIWEAPRKVVPVFCVFSCLAAVAWQAASLAGWGPYSLRGGALALTLYLCLSAGVLFVFFHERARWAIRTMLRARSPS